MCPNLLTMLFAVAAGGGVPPAAPAASAEELVRRAGAVRRKAEDDLATARQRILTERKALAAELQQAYADLSAAAAQAESARESLRRLKAETAEAQRDSALVAHRVRSEVARAAASAGAKVGPSDPLEAAERAIWGAFRSRLARIEDDTKVSIRQEAIVARDGGEARVPVLRLGGYAAYACGGGRRTCGLLRSLPDGRKRVVGPYLNTEQAEALRAAAAGNLASLPVDVDGALQDRAPAEPKNIRAWLEAGGMFIIPIVIVGAVGLILVLERIGYLLLTKGPPSLVEQTLSRVGRRDLAGARQVLAASRTPTARVLRAGIDAQDLSPDQREGAMESALLAEAPRLERSLSLLAALAGVAPLLGLLGTVSGMIATFETISTAGTSNPRLLSGGISEALITTQLGLMVAIPLLLAHAWLRRWVERREALLEYNAIEVFGIDSGREGPVA